MHNTLVRGRIWNPVGLGHWEFIPDGVLVISGNGRVEALGDSTLLKQYSSDCRILDYSDFLIIPGLVDTHIHLPQLPIRGIQAGTLLEWLHRYAFPVEEAFADPDHAQKVADLFFHALKANGTTTALVYASVHEEATHRAFASARAAGMRVLMGKVMMDRNVPASMQESLQESVDASERLARAWQGEHDGLLSYAFTPRFAISCTPELLEAAGDLHRRYPGTYLQTHLSENPEEIAEVKFLFSEGPTTYTEVYEAHGCLGPRSVMAHAIHLDDSELALLAETQTKVSHCPTSNFFLKSGFFNYPAMMRHGIQFGLGTDIGGGPDLSLFPVMRAMESMQLHHRVFVSPTEALYHATLGGATALSLAEETGNLSPGKSADFVVLDIESLSAFTSWEQPIEDIISQLMYLGSDRQVMQTFVRGKEIYSRADDLTISRERVSIPEGVLLPPRR